MAKITNLGIKPFFQSIFQTSSAERTTPTILRSRLSQSPAEMQRATARNKRLIAFVTGATCGVGATAAFTATVFLSSAALAATGIGLAVLPFILTPLLCWLLLSKKQENRSL